MYNRLGLGLGLGRGRGPGRGSGGGMGFGFRGASPPWPYVGRGRGGLPRCGYYLKGPGVPPTLQPGRPATAGTTREQELGNLRNQAEAVKEQLEEIESRIKQLSAEKEQEGQ